MDREDIKLAMDMYYEEMGWDTKTGSPTAAAYRRLGLGNVADDLTKKGFCPRRETWSNSEKISPAIAKIIRERERNWTARAIRGDVEELAEHGLLKSEAVGHGV